MNEERQALAQSLLGAVLVGSYRIERLLGEGGMGAVYEATQVRLNKRVAIKVMARELAANPEALARFRREAEVTSGLGHPHIVQVFDFGATPTGEPFLAMELLGGEDLEHRLRREGRLSLAGTVHVVRQVAGALAATHAHGVVHRDLKPANIYLLAAAGEADFVKVLDFGISKVRAATTKLTKVTMVMGTPNYMSPEQALGRVDEIDERTDQWALACIAWECLSGAGPFFGDSVPAILFQVVHEAPHPLAAKVPGLPPDVVDVLLRALAKDKNDRFADVAAFSRALELAGANAPSPTLVLAPAPRPLAAATGAPPTTFTQSAGAVDDLARPPRSSRSRWMVGLGSAALAGLLLMGGLWVVGARSTGPSTSAAGHVPALPRPTTPAPVGEPPAAPQAGPKPGPPAPPIETPSPSTALDPPGSPAEATGSATGKQGKRKRGGGPLARPALSQDGPRVGPPPSQAAPTAPAPPSGGDNVPKGGDKW